MVYIELYIKYIRMVEFTNCNANIDSVEFIDAEREIKT